jgi:hypothetical protein
MVRIVFFRRQGANPRFGAIDSYLELLQAVNKILPFGISSTSSVSTMPSLPKSLRSEFSHGISTVKNMKSA